MLNGENNTWTTDVDLTQIAKYFPILENAILPGDTNKKYKVAQNSCEGASAPFRIGGWTSVPISPQGDNMADLYNSYITCEMDLGPLTSNLAALSGDSPKGQNQPAIVAYYPDSFMSLEQYQIVVNGQAIYTQSWATEEGYITDMTTTDAVRKVDVFSKVRHEDVWNGEDTVKAGVIYTNANQSDPEGHILQFKIDLRRFLPLAAVRYLPEFVGNVELRLKFSLGGLVIGQLGPEAIAGNPFNMHLTTLDKPITCKPIPYSELVAGNLVGITSAAISSGNKLALTANKIAGHFTKEAQIVKCVSHIACFGLDNNIYQQLIAHYTADGSANGPAALTFPIQTLTFHQMNGNLANNEGFVNVSLSAVPRFVDSIFILFPMDSNYRACYDNILAENFALKMGGYGQAPEITYESFGPEYYESISNVFNTNNDSQGFNQDVMRSMTNDVVNSTGYYSKDTTKFVLGFPVSTDNTFQQGQTSNTTINYQLQMKLLKNDGATANPFVANKNCNPLIGFLQDSVFAIQLQRSGPPVVSIDDYDITSPAI